MAVVLYTDEYVEGFVYNVQHQIWQFTDLELGKNCMLENGKNVVWGPRAGIIYIYIYI